MICGCIRRVRMKNGVISSHDVRGNWIANETWKSSFFRKNLVLNG